MGMDMELFFVGWMSLAFYRLRLQERRLDLLPKGYGLQYEARHRNVTHIHFQLFSSIREKLL